MTSKLLPQNVTSYDLIKTLAVLLMIVDHVGYYLYPDVEIYRMIGRACVPIWMFLVGYAHTRDITAMLLGGTVVLVAMHFVVGLPIMPLNILATVIIVRLCLDFFAAKMFKFGSATRFATFMTLFIFVFPTSVYGFYYGTSAILLALVGYAVRHQQSLKLTTEFINMYTVFALMAFLFWQVIVFIPSQSMGIVMAVGTLCVGVMLLSFKAVEFPKLSDKLPGFIGAMLRFTGRRTLEIYVVHLIALMVYAAYAGDARTQWIRYDLFAKPYHYSDLNTPQNASLPIPAAEIPSPSTDSSVDSAED